MEARLFIFAVFLILFGFATNIYFVSVFGFFLLVPAFLISPRPPTTVKAEQRKEMPARISPPLKPVTAEPANPPIEVPMAPPPSMSSQPSATTALFPRTMFPSLSATLKAPGATEPQQAVTTSRDEVLEVGLILAVLRAVAG